MAGMGDPYGLIEDESDFLLHPAKILNGEGIKYYGNYRYSFRDIKDWDVDIDYSNTSGTLNQYWEYDISGDEQKHEALLGAAFPLMNGRLGVFFEYDSKRAGYEGDQKTVVSGNISGSTDFWDYTLDNDFNDFALRFIYGLPLQIIQTGLEVEIAYRDEEKNTWANNRDLSVGTENYIWTMQVPERSLLFFMVPYDSEYWEVLMKLGLEKKVNSTEMSLTLRGGYIINSDNSYKYKFQAPLGDNDYNVNIDDGVDGYSIGGNIWLRHKLGNGYTLPFFLSIDFLRKERDGDGFGRGGSDIGLLYNYEHRETEFKIKVGGGVEKKVGENILIGAGLYYNYSQKEEDIWLSRSDTSVDNNNNKFPLHNVHQFSSNIAGERVLSPSIALRTGFDFFYGWEKEDYERVDILNADDGFMDGCIWGIGASAGGTVKLQQCILEPFINGGFQRLDIDGDGDRTARILNQFEMDKDRNEWFVSGGVSVQIGK